MESSRNILSVTETKRIAQFTCVSILLLFSLLTSNLIAQSYAKVNINNISTYVWNDGRMDISPASNAGFEYLKGTKRFSVFSSGVYWGGYIGNELRIGGTRYRTSLFPGNENGNSRIYRIRPDYLKANLLNEISDENLSESEIRKNYDTDYRKWPVALGAPFDDINHDNTFTDGIDKPGFPNADQTLWLLCNDFEINRNDETFNPFYSKPTEIELQITVWAYTKDDLLKGVIFKHYKLVNKSKTKTMKDMYVGIFTDPDIGNAMDDYAGCDTSLGLGYIYNSQNIDKIFGDRLTVIGSLLLQSPKINSTSTDFASVNGKKVFGKKEVGMTSFTYQVFETCDYCDPGPDQPKYFYNSLQGLSYRYGSKTINPITNKSTKFPFSGDPVSNTGFVDFYLEPVYDRQLQINSGPFNMAPGDTQEVIFAQIVTSGTSRLGLVTYLKYLAKHVKDFFKNEMFKNVTAENEPTEIPAQYSLSQNYPNPFNPETTINYSIPKNEHVTLKVFDVLGCEVATLVDEYKNTGTYNVVFNVKTRHGASLQSGIYFYRLTAGSYSDTKKMILMK